MLHLTDVTAKKKLKIDIDKLVNVQTSFNNSKTKLDDLDLGELKVVPMDFKKLSYVVKNKVVKKRQNSTRWKRK